MLGLGSDLALKARPYRGLDAFTVSFLEQRGTKAGGPSVASCGTQRSVELCWRRARACKAIPAVEHDKAPLLWTERTVSAIVCCPHRSAAEQNFLLNEPAQHGLLLRHKDSTLSALAAP